MQRTIGYQIARIITALLVAVPSTFAIATVTAGATTCLPTTFSRDGFFLTAAQIGAASAGRSTHRVATSGSTSRPLGA